MSDLSEFLYYIIYKHELTDFIVQFPFVEVDQSGKACMSGLSQKQMKDVESKIGRSRDMKLKNTALFIDYPNEENLPSCKICQQLYGKLGKQRIVCNEKHSSFHEWTLSEEQLGKITAQLLDRDNDPETLANVKKLAQKNMPKTSFKRRTRVHYIEAGPGCGKSYIIRQLATENDLVLAPFCKLRPDYENIQGPDGKYSLPFKTQHRAMEVKGCSRIFVDEFTSFPYEYLACIAYNNAADDVFLVGDMKQTKIIEPDEGLYIGNSIELGNMSTHNLLVNFKNPPDTVALLNKLFGYKMRSAREPTKLKSAKELFVTVINKEDDDQTKRSLRMCFSKASAIAETENDKNTVRANQGGTYDDVRLYVNVKDKSLITTECLQVVALSRHTTSLTIVKDDSTQ